MYLEEIIGKQVFEDLTHEFKARLDRTDIVGWLKTIAGFANNIGGELFIGVEDKTSKLIGFDRKGADNERNFFNNMVNEHLYPRPGIQFHSSLSDTRGRAIPVSSQSKQGKCKTCCH